jgi:hypothetical protein
MSGLGLDHIREYFVGLNMGTAIVDRGLVGVEIAEQFLPEPIDYAFVGEYRDEENNPQYESIWLFTTDDHFDIVPTRNGLERIDVSRDNFDFTTATDKSRLTVYINIPGSSGITGTFKAAGSNCLHLTEILKDYLLPLLQRD